MKLFWIQRCSHCRRFQFRIGKRFGFPRMGWMGGHCHVCFYESLQKVVDSADKSKAVHVLFVPSELEKNVIDIKRAGV